VTDKKKEKRQFWFILTLVFLGFLGISIPYLIFPALFLNPAYSILSPSWNASSRALFLGITLAAYPLGQFIGSPILGSLSDDYGRKKLLSGSLFVAAICNLFSAMAISWQNLGLLIASRFVAGLMEGNIAIARAMAVDLTTLSKQETFGKINAAASIAFLVGPLLGGIMTEKSLFENLTVSTPFYFTCILFFCLALFSTRMVETGVINPQTQKKNVWQRVNLFKRLSFLFSNKHLRFLMIVSTCFTLAVDIFYEFAPVYLTVKWTLGPAQLVLYNAVLCLGLAIGNGWLPVFISSRISSRLAISISMGGLALFLLGIILTNSSILIMLLFLFVGFAVGIAVTLITVKISNAVSENIQGEVMGVQLSLRVLGDAFICLFGGILLILSSKIILFIAAILSLFATLYYYTSCDLKKTKR
jgi:DHA1 family tetracycline resistance protein-like MFS transporter